MGHLAICLWGEEDPGEQVSVSLDKLFHQLGQYHAVELFVVLPAALSSEQSKWKFLQSISLPVTAYSLLPSDPPITNQRLLQEGLKLVWLRANHCSHILSIHLTPIAIQSEIDPQDPLELEGEKGEPLQLFPAPSHAEDQWDREKWLLKFSEIPTLLALLQSSSQPSPVEVLQLLEKQGWFSPILWNFTNIQWAQIPTLQKLTALDSPPIETLSTINISTLEQFSKFLCVIMYGTITDSGPSSSLLELLKYFRVRPQTERILSMELQNSSRTQIMLEFMPTHYLSQESKVLSQANDMTYLQDGLKMIPNDSQIKWTLLIPLQWEAPFQNSWLQWSVGHDCPITLENSVTPVYCLPTSNISDLQTAFTTWSSQDTIKMALNGFFSDSYIST
jgi:hypothetical protein